MKYKNVDECNVIYLDPPGAPHIDGYNEGDILEKGTHVSLHCESKAGNPPTQLTWFKNDQMIHNVYRCVHLNYVIISKLY